MFDDGYLFYGVVLHFPRHVALIYPRTEFAICNVVSPCKAVSGNCELVLVTKTKYSQIFLDAILPPFLWAAT